MFYIEVEYYKNRPEWKDTLLSATIVSIAVHDLDYRLLPRPAGAATGNVCCTENEVQSLVKTRRISGSLLWERRHKPCGPSRPNFVHLRALWGVELPERAHLNLANHCGEDTKETAEDFQLSTMHPTNTTDVRFTSMVSTWGSKVDVKTWCSTRRPDLRVSSHTRATKTERKRKLQCSCGWTLNRSTQPHRELWS